MIHGSKFRRRFNSIGLKETKKNSFFLKNIQKRFNPLLPEFYFPLIFEM